MSNAVVPMQDVMKMAEAVAKSGLFGVKSPDQALALMLVAQAEGRHPALAARDYDIIQGRPAKKTEAMLRDFLENRGKVEWHTLDDSIADATFSHPDGGSVRVAWDMKRAGTAGLASRDMWRKFPRQMLRSRCVSEGIRTVCPMATSGMYVPEEIRDIVEKDVTPSRATPTAGANERVAPDRIAIVDDVALKVLDWLNSGSVADAVVELDNHGLDADEQIYLWTQFDSKQRAAMKKEESRQKAERKALPQVSALPQAAPEKTLLFDELISPAQHKRMEARIKQLGADRDKLKAYVLEKFGIEHLDKLTKDAYKAVDAMLDAKERKASTPTDTDPTLARIAACTALDALEVVADAFTDEEAVKYLAAYTARKNALLDEAAGGQV